MVATGLSHQAGRLRAQRLSSSTGKAASPPGPGGTGTLSALIGMQKVVGSETKSRLE
jgi:hypothetical protein